MLASGGASDREPALTRDSTVSSTLPAGFGRFRVVHQLGAGVHGPVFLGVDPEGDRQVAIKAFSLDIIPERAVALAAALTRLVATPLGHPSIVALTAAGAEGSTVYLVQDYVVAESVDAAVREYGPAPVPDALRVVGQLAGALDFAAAAGVHHGALHPRDVLVAPHEVRLTGLGVAGAFEEVGLRVTPRRPYAAPERRERASWGTPADVFSLAAVAFELLTGRRPGSVEALANEARSIPSPDPAVLAGVFARALSPRPDDRYQTALAFAAALRQALTGEPIERPEVPPAIAAVVPAAAGQEAPGEEEAEAEGEGGTPGEEVAPAGEEVQEIQTPIAEAEASPPIPPELAVFSPEPVGEAAAAVDGFPAAEQEQQIAPVDEPAAGALAGGADEAMAPVEEPSAAIDAIEQVPEIAARVEGAGGPFRGAPHGAFAPGGGPGQAGWTAGRNDTVAAAGRSRRVACRPHRAEGVPPLDRGNPGSIGCPEPRDRLPRAEAWRH